MYVYCTYKNDRDIKSTTHNTNVTPSHKVCIVFTHLTFSLFNCSQFSNVSKSPHRIGLHLKIATRCYLHHVYIGQWPLWSSG